jgi:hypothetical protein
MTATLPAYRRFIRRDRNVIAWTYLMTALAWLTFGTTVGVISPLLYLRTKKKPRRDPSRRSSKHAQAQRHVAHAKNRYHAVSIRPSLCACPAAWKMQDQSFLSNESPSLPLAACDQETCSCRYRHYDDRRDGEDRRNRWGQTGGLLPHPGQNDWRTGSDRRIKLL